MRKGPEGKALERVRCEGTRRSCVSVGPFRGLGDGPHGLGEELVCATLPVNRGRKQRTQLAIPQAKLSLTCRTKRSNALIPSRCNFQRQSLPLRHRERDALVSLPLPGIPVCGSSSSRPSRADAGICLAPARSSHHNSVRRYSVADMFHWPIKFAPFVLTLGGAGILRCAQLLHVLRNAPEQFKVCRLRTLFWASTSAEEN